MYVYRRYSMYLLDHYTMNKQISFHSKSIETTPRKRTKMRKRNVKHAANNAQPQHAPHSATPKPVFEGNKKKKGGRGGSV